MFLINHFVIKYIRVQNFIILFCIFKYFKTFSVLKFCVFTFPKEREEREGGRELKFCK